MMITVIWLAFVIQLLVAMIAGIHAIWDRQQRWLYVFRGSLGWLLFSIGFIFMAVRRGVTLYNYYFIGNSIPTENILSLVNSCVFLLAVTLIVLSERKLKTEYEDVMIMAGRCSKKAEALEERLA